MENPVIIIGAKGLGVVAMDIFLSNDVVIYGFLDDDTTLHGQEINGIPVLGHTENEGFLKLIGKKCEAFVATDDNKVRKSHVEYLLETRHVMPVNAIHANAQISQYAEISHGTMVCSGAIISANAKIGNHCIINANALIDYETQVGNFVQVGAGSIINGNVTIEENAFIGSGVTVVSGVKIGKNARVGAGSVVIESVPANATVFGNPAQKI